MVAALERGIATATVIDRRGNTAPQGILPNIKFQSQEGRILEMEKSPTLQHAVLFNLYEDFSYCFDEEPSEGHRKSFVNLMREAFKSAGKGMEKVVFSQETPPLLVEITSNPKIRGIRALFGDGHQGVFADLGPSWARIVGKGMFGEIYRYSAEDYLTQPDEYIEDPDRYEYELGVLDEMESVGKLLNAAIFGDYLPGGEEA